MNSATLSSDELIHLGKRAYKEKNYEAAYQNFLSAINLTRSPTVDILDCIAAAAEKKDDFQASLKYGRQMIQLDECNARGYLRVGRTLQGNTKEDHRKTAMAIYERGIKKVGALDPNLKLLQSMRERVYRSLYPPTACDPFSRLPHEVAEMVLGYLEFFELVICLRVCKPWNLFLSSNLRAWTTLDLDHGSGRKQRKIPAQFVKNCIRNSSYMLHTANLGCFSHRPTLVAMAKCCKALKEIQISEGSDLGGDSIMETIRFAKSLQVLKVMAEVSCDQVSQILRIRPSLTEVQLHHITSPSINYFERDGFVEMVHLNTLVLHGLSQDYIRYWQASSIPEKLPNLEILDLHRVMFDSPLDLRELLKLKHLALSRCNSQGLWLPPTLEHISLIRCSGGAVRNNDMQVNGNLPALQVLSLNHDSWACCQTVIEQLLLTPRDTDPLQAVRTDLCRHESLSELREFTVYTTSEINIDILLHPRLYSVERLGLRLPKSTDETIQALAGLDQYKKLVTVHLADSFVTGVGLKALVTSQPNLKVLTLENCTMVSPDAVAWAQGQGIQVNTIMGLVTGSNSSAKAGRAVRYGD